MEDDEWQADRQEGKEEEEEEKEEKEEKKKASHTWAVTWKEPSPMLAMTRFFPFRAWAYPSVAPTDQPIDPNCIWNSYLQFEPNITMTKRPGKTDQPWSKLPTIFL